jgi:D-alanyl-D-alanine carboxypeptidase
MLRYLIRATAVGGANDAATALAEAVAGSEPEFVDMMNTKAKALGMNGSHFTNAHGLTEEGITTTALDVAILFRALNDDYPQYMNVFARRSDNAGVGSVSHSGSRFLEISQNIYAAKTGYTKEAKFTAVVMVDNDIRQLIIVGLGGDSTGSLRKDVGRLIDEWLERRITIHNQK